MMYDLWNVKCDRQNFLSLWAIFCPFTPLTMQKIKIKKKKKTSGDIIILHKCTKIHDMLYSSWNMVCDRLFFILGYFLPFYPHNSPKIKILKKRKNTWRYYHFTYVYQKLWSDDVQLLRYGVRWMDGQMDGQADRKSDI